MAVAICPYRSVNPDVFQKVCLKEQCPIWHELLQMCSQKATALYLHDLHSVVLLMAEKSGLVIREMEEKNE